MSQSWSCCVPFCANKTGDVLPQSQSDLSFHCIPQSKELREKWLVEMRRTEGVRDFRITESTRVCSAHFKPEDFQIHSTERLLKETALPSFFLWNSATFTKARLLQVSSTIKEVRLKNAKPITFLCHKEAQTWESMTFKDQSSQANLVRHPLCDPALIGEYSQCKDHPLPDIFRSAIICINKFTDLTFSFHLWQGGLPTYMEITRVGWYGTPCLGQVPAKVTLSSGGEMHFVVLCAKPITCNVQEKNGDFDLKQFSEFLFKLSKSSRNVWCSGLPQESDKRCPLTRKQSKDCEVYYTSRVRNETGKAIASGIGRCPACRRKKISLAAYARKRIPGFREKRVQRGSRCPITSLSPESKRKRLENYKQTEEELRKKVAALKFQLQKCEDQDITCISRSVKGAGDLDLDCTTEVHSGENSCGSDISDWTDESEPENKDDEQRCKICGRTFKQKQSLQRHLRVHQSSQHADDEFACDIGSVQRRLQTNSDSLGQRQVKADVLLDIISMLM